MNYAEAADDISYALGVLATQVAAENQAGQFSKNRLSEDIFLPVFRVLFAAKTLKNVNEGPQNFPDIDLVDEKAKLAIQITSDRGSAKVTNTLTGFVQRKAYNKYKRLVIFALTAYPVAPTSATKAKWRQITKNRFEFAPTRDIIAIPRLQALILARPLDDILAIRDILDRSVIGKRHVDLPALLRNQAQLQLDTEIRATKYIPDVFVETWKTKDLARCFAHPVLFLARSREAVARMNPASFGNWLEKIGVEPPKTEVVLSKVPAKTLAETTEMATGLHRQISSLMVEIAPLEKASTKKLKLKHPDRKYLFEERSWEVQQAAWGMRYRFEDRLEELRACTTRFLVVTGRAGQGKTNFACDFLERFLWRHEVDAAFISGRRLRAMKGTDMGDILRQVIVGDAISSFPLLASQLSERAKSRNRPFVLVVDGLNEHLHPDFVTHLESFLNTLLSYDNLRVLFTCRSEFFETRFGKLFYQTFAAETLVVKNEFFDRDKQPEKLLRAYFKFFGIRPSSVREGVIETISDDMLMLRFFCEAYGSRGKPADYQQPNVFHIYRDQIFRIYLGNKLQAGADFLEAKTGATAFLDPEAKLREVLKLVVAYMVDNWVFTDVPRTVVPANLEDALVALLDEDVILRADIGPTPLFAAPRDTLNFTFDELRDYMVAQFLVNSTFATDPTRFAALLDRTPPENTPSIEGIKRFMFYNSRRRGNESFWESYRKHRWYDDVYDEEILNIEGELVRDDDIEEIRTALRSGGRRSVYFARQLAVNWYTDAHPRLNLQLLLEFAAEASDNQFDDTIVPAFNNRSYQESSFLEQVCNLANKILPQFEPGLNVGHDRVFLLLAVLLPLGSNGNLYSEAGEVLGTLGRKHPQFALRILRQALAFTSTRQKAHIWRAISYLPDEVVRTPDVQLEATAARHEAANGSVLAREIDRVLTGSEAEEDETSAWLTL